MGGILKKIAAFIAANKASRALSAWGSWFASSWIFDSILYPAVIGIIGPIYGGVLMTSIAMFICWVWLKSIVASEKEWFSMDIMHKIQRIIFWVVRLLKYLPFLKKSWIDAVEVALTFVIISMQFDPMIATLYFRYGDQSSKINKKDIKIFLWSGLVSNLYWTLRSWGIVLVLKYLWKLVF